jgi:cation transport ATPase
MKQWGRAIKWFSLALLLLLSFSGLLMQMNYHMGHHPESLLCMGMNKEGWLWLHKIVSLLFVVLAGYHIYQRRKWLLRFLKRNKNQQKQKVKTNSLWLSLLFVPASITAFISWFILTDPHSDKALIEIHDKLGILITVFLIIHLLQHRRWFGWGRDLK